MKMKRVAVGLSLAFLRSAAVPPADMSAPRLRPIQRRRRSARDQLERLLIGAMAGYAAEATSDPWQSRAVRRVARSATTGQSGMFVAGIESRRRMGRYIGARPQPLALSPCATKIRASAPCPAGRRCSDQVLFLRPPPAFAFADNKTVSAQVASPADERFERGRQGCSSGLGRRARRWMMDGFARGRMVGEGRISRIAAFDSQTHTSQPSCRPVSVRRAALGG